jgi:hypothetical protein
VGCGSQLLKSGHDAQNPESEKGMSSYLSAEQVAQVSDAIYPDHRERCNQEYHSDYSCSDSNGFRCTPFVLEVVLSDSQ